jgi:hypothetical protein
MTSPEPAPDVPPPEEARTTEALRHLGDLPMPPAVQARIAAALRAEAALRQRLDGDALDQGRDRFGSVSVDSPLEQSDEPARESKSEHR